MISPRATAKCSTRSPTRSLGRQRSRSSISPVAPARRCERWDPIFHRVRAGGWSTTVSVFWRGPLPPNIRRTSTSRPRRSISPAPELPLVGPLDLVTTSALPDLVSPEWLDRLVAEVAARRLPFYAALTYDGRAVAAPPQRFDDELLAGFNLHQRTDKGFGPAL